MKYDHLSTVELEILTAAHVEDGSYDKAMECLEELIKRKELALMNSGRDV